MTWWARTRIWRATRRAGRQVRRSSSMAAIARHEHAIGHELGRGARVPRPADAGQGIGDLRRRDRDLRRDAHSRRGARDGAARTRRRSGRRRRPARIQLHRIRRDDLRRQPSRCDRDADQLASRCAGVALHPRPLRGACTGVRRITRRPRQRGDEGHRARTRPRLHRAARTRRMDGTRRSPHGLRFGRSGGRRRRRRPPADVHVRDHRTAQGRHAHPRQPGVEEPRARHRVRLHQRRPRSCVRSALPRRRPRSDDHVAHRRRRHHDHPPRVQRRRGRRRDRAVAGDHGVARARNGERDHGVARHRPARPLVGARHHQRRREDAHPTHRAHPAHVPVGVVRRRVRPHRDRLRRHLPRPGQHRDQTRQRRPSVPLSRARHLG